MDTVSYSSRTNLILKVNTRKNSRIRRRARLTAVRSPKTHSKLWPLEKQSESETNYEIGTLEHGTDLLAWKSVDLVLAVEPEAEDVDLVGRVAEQEQQVEQDRRPEEALQLPRLDLQGSLVLVRS